MSKKFTENKYSIMPLIKSQKKFETDIYAKYYILIPYTRNIKTCMGMEITNTEFVIIV